MKCTIKYVLLTAVKAKKVYDLLFLEAHNTRSCIESAKLDGYKTVASKSGTKSFECDPLDVNYQVTLCEMCAAIPCDFVWNDTASKLEESGDKPPLEEESEAVNNG